MTKDQREFPRKLQIPIDMQKRSATLPRRVAILVSAGRASVDGAKSMPSAVKRG